MERNLIFAARINDSQLTGLVEIKQGSKTLPEVYCYCSEEVAKEILSMKATSKKWGKLAEDIGKYYAEKDEEDLEDGNLCDIGKTAAMAFGYL